MLLELVFIWEVWRLKTDLGGNGSGQKFDALAVHCNINHES